MANLQLKLEIQSALEMAYDRNDYETIYKLEQELEKLEQKEQEKDNEQIN